MPLLGFRHDSTIAKKEVYDVLFYFKKGKNEGRRRDNDRFEQRQRQRDGSPRKGRTREGRRSRMMRSGGGARAAALALDDVPRQEEPRRTRALPLRKNVIGRRFRRREISIADDPLQTTVTREQPISSSSCVDRRVRLEDIRRLFITGSYWKKMDGRGRRRNGL